MQKLVIAMGMLLTVTLSISAAAQTGAEGYFGIYNNTTNNVVVGFYTNDGGGWSRNWLYDDIEPGEAAEAEFDASSGSCDQLIRVGWLSDNGGEVRDEPISIDICDASNIYVDDNEIYYD